MAIIIAGATGSTGNGSGTDINNPADYQAIQDQLNPGDVVQYVDIEGDYRFPLLPASSGISGERIIHTKYAGHIPTWSFAIDLNGGWSKVSGTDGVDAIYKKSYLGGNTDVNPAVIFADDFPDHPISRWWASHAFNAIGPWKDDVSRNNNIAQAPHPGMSVIHNINTKGKDNYVLLPCQEALTSCLYSSSVYTYNEANQELYIRTPNSDHPDNYNLRGIKTGSNTERSSLWVDGHHFITFSGLKCEFPWQFIRFWNSSNLTINGCSFQYSRYPGDIIDSSWIRLLNSSWNYTGDIVGHAFDTISLDSSTTAVNCHHILVQGNTGEVAAHSFFGSNDTRYVIFDNNTLSDIFGRGISLQHKWNLSGLYGDTIVQNNKITRYANADQIVESHWADHEGIKAGSNRTLSRNNQVWNGAQAMSHAPANFNGNKRTKNYSCHNVMAYGQPTRGITCGGLNIDWEGDGGTDTPKAKNELFIDNRHAYQYAGFDSWTSVMLYGGGSNGINIFNSLNGELKGCLFYNSNGDYSTVLNRMSIAAAEALSSNISGNTSGDPLIVSGNLNNPDFHIKNGSAAIGTGDHLALTVGAYSGNTLVVDDSYWFRDGYGLIPGDEIRVGNDTVRIVSPDGGTLGIDHSTHTITHDGNISGPSGTPVNYEWMMDDGQISPTIGVFAFSNTTGSTVIPITAQDVYYTGSKGDPLTSIDVIALSNATGSNLTISHVDYNGTNTLVDNTDLIDYTPAANYIGNESAQITLTDGITSTTFTLFITVNDISVMSKAGVQIDNTQATLTGDWISKTDKPGYVGADFAEVGEEI